MHLPAAAETTAPRCAGLLLAGAGLELLLLGLLLMLRFRSAGGRWRVAPESLDADGKQIDGPVGEKPADRGGIGDIQFRAARSRDRPVRAGKRRGDGLSEPARASGDDRMRHARTLDCHLGNLQ